MALFDNLSVNSKNAANHRQQRIVSSEPKKTRKAFINVVRDYAAAATTHGIVYVFDRSRICGERFLWLIIVLSFIGLASYWSYAAYRNWQENPVLTSVSTTGLPVEQIEFPAITICSQGFINEVVKNCFNYKFKKDLKEKGIDLDKLSGSETEKTFLNYMNDVYAGVTNLKDVVQAFSGSNPSGALVSSVAVSGGYNPCEQNELLNTTINVNITTICDAGWIQSEITKRCYKLTSTKLNHQDALKECTDDGAYMWKPFSELELSKLILILQQGILGQEILNQPFWIGSVNYTLINFVSVQPLGNGSCFNGFLNDSIIWWNTRDCYEPMIYGICFYDLVDCNDQTNTPLKKRKRRQTFDSSSASKLDLLLNPEFATKNKILTAQKQKNMRDSFKKLNKKNVYSSMFDIFWYSQLPCFDVKEVTSNYQGQYGMIKKCKWKNIDIPCSIIFDTFPTDRGMCCTFNIKKAEKIFRQGRYSEQLIRLQAQDKLLAFDTNNSKASKWYFDNKEPKTQVGRTKGLSLLLDAHTDTLSGSSVWEDFRGFTAVVQSRREYPITSRKSVLLRPGHNNIVSLSASRVISNKNIRDIQPNNRNCYFSNEYVLKAHTFYTQANCLLECMMNSALRRMPNICLPYYLPSISNHSICDPWQAFDFQLLMHKTKSHIECTHCLPDCSITTYTSSISAAPFRRCDYRNLGMSNLCQFDDTSSIPNPPLWGQQVRDQYQLEIQNIPDFVTQTGSSNIRKHFTEGEGKSSIFSASIENDPNYDAYEKDIATVEFFFETPTVLEFTRQARMTWIEFISQIGGLLGLCIGFSMISGVEIIYWFTFRFWSILHGP